MTDQDDTTTRQELRRRLRIAPEDVEAVNALLCDDRSPLMDGLLDLVDEFGGVDTINGAADEAGDLGARLARLEAERSPWLDDLDWLRDQRDTGRVRRPRRVPGWTARRGRVTRGRDTADRRGQRRHP